MVTVARAGQRAARASEGEEHTEGTQAPCHTYEGDRKGHCPTPHWTVLSQDLGNKGKGGEDTVLGEQTQRTPTHRG